MKASQARYDGYDRIEYDRIMEELGRAQDQVTALEQMQIEANAIPGPRGREVMVPSPNGQPYGTGTPDNTFLPNPGPSTIQKTDPDMTAEKLLDLAQKMKEEEMGVDHGVEVAELRPVEDPIDRLREEYDFPEEWLEGLEDEEPPSPERLRSLAEGIAKREVNDEIELPAKAFARVLLLMARQIEMPMEWIAFRRDGDTVHPHRHVRVIEGPNGYRVEMIVPKHVCDYGPKARDRHFNQRFTAGLNGISDLRGK